MDSRVIHIIIHRRLCVHTQRERERERETDRQTDRQTETETERASDRWTAELFT